MVIPERKQYSFLLHFIVTNARSNEALYKIRSNSPSVSYLCLICMESFDIKAYKNLAVYVHIVGET